MFGVTILGNNSAIPAFDRHPTAQVVTIKDQLLLLDCGEGTQMQIAKYRIKSSKINYVFISHLHGDHYFGLIGLITTMSLLNREKELHIFGPKELEDILNIQLNVANTVLSYSLHFHAISKEKIILETSSFQVECFKTNHRIECWGFLIREKKAPRKINKEKVLQHQIPLSFYSSLQLGKDYTTKEGLLIKNIDVTDANSNAKSYAYCADTIYDETLVDKVQNVSLLYHETTYLKDGFEKASQRFHTTSTQAATIASKAKVDKLIIGHFSSKYENIEPFLVEAKEVFENTELAIEGLCFKI